MVIENGWWNDVQLPRELIVPVTSWRIVCQVGQNLGARLRRDLFRLVWGGHGGQVNSLHPFGE